MILVPYKGLDGQRIAPTILVECGGVKENSKLLLANKVVIDWMAVMKKESANISKKNSCNGKFQW